LSCLKRGRERHKSHFDAKSYYVAPEVHAARNQNCASGLEYQKKKIKIGTSQHVIECQKYITTNPSHMNLWLQHLHVILPSPEPFKSNMLIHSIHPKV